LRGRSGSAREQFGSVHREEFGDRAVRPVSRSTACVVMSHDSGITHVENWFSIITRQTRQSIRRGTRADRHLCQLAPQQLPTQQDGICPGWKAATGSGTASSSALHPG
jgi:hypothetical protein